MTILRVHVVPNAKIDSVVGEHGGAIKIKLRAPAVEGKANAALIRFLAEQLKLSRHAIVLERGHRSRDKLIRIDELGEDDVRRQLLAKNRNQSPAIP
jgi:uncharacterized protein